MGYSVYFSEKNNRWQGYGVPAYCDHPECKNVIDRGMGYACCDDPMHEASCGGFYCSDHQEQYIYADELKDMTDEELKAVGLDSGLDPDDYDGIVACTHKPIERKEHPDWIKHIETDDSWKDWREENPQLLAEMKALSGV